MAALRERYSARHGVGHADRSWLDYALCVDTQSGSICLSPGGRREPNAYANRISQCYSDADSFCHSYRNRKRNSDAYCNSYTFWKADADSKASSDSKASVTRTSAPALQDRRRRASGS
jgi:hypothetical protein